MEENNVITNEERINQLAQEIEYLKEEQKKMDKYKKFKENADEAGIQAAMIRDSLCANGFTEEQAFQLMMQTIATNTSTRSIF